MLKVALTGSALSGKNTVAKLLKGLEIPTFDADLATKFLIHYNSAIISKIKKKFGPAAYEVGFLKSEFFKTDSQFKDLFAIVKDDIQELYHKFLNKHKNASYVIFKCSYFYEMNLYKWEETKLTFGPHTSDDSQIIPMELKSIMSTKKAFFDAIINVYAPKDIRTFRNSKIKEKRYGIINEFSPQTKKELSTYNIESYDGMDLLKQLDTIHESLLNKAKGNDIGNLEANL